MASAKEHGITKVEKVKRDKKRWRGKERRMHGRSSKIGKDGKKEGGGGGGLSMWLCCFHVCQLKVGHCQPRRRIEKHGFCFVQELERSMINSSQGSVTAVYSGHNAAKVMVQWERRY